MKKWIGGLLVGTLLIVCIFLLTLSSVRKSFISDGETKDRILDLKAEVVINRDEDGITYITAENDLDAISALGYAHAQDRLWQMEIMRRAGEGRLSELFGSKTIGYDIFLRTVGFKTTSINIWNAMSEKTKQALRAYCKGVNSYILSHKGKRPFEFDVLNYELEPWTPLHSILISRLLAWELNTSFWNDLVLEQIKSKVDSVRFNDIIPYYPSYAPTIIPGGQFPEPLLDSIRIRDSVSNFVVPDSAKLLKLMSKAKMDSLLKETYPTKKFNSKNSTKVNNFSKKNKKRVSFNSININDLNELISIDRNLRKFIGIDGAHIGSNSWVLSGSRTSSGKPILANDPHLQHSAPSKWYQIIIAYKGDRLAGVTLPGVPFVIIGRNNYIAWGITNMMADETDFYIEQKDSLMKNYVIYDGKREPLKVLSDTIKVKDTLSVPFEIRISKHGPIISECNPFSSKYQIDFPYFKKNKNSILSKNLISMKWQGNNVSQDISAFQWINNARNLDEFVGAVKLGGCPGLNFVYASSSGTIAYVPSYKIPIRYTGIKSILPYQGNDSKYDWKGEYPFTAIPMLVNPPSGYIATANNKVTNDTKFPAISDLWEDPSRAIRLAQLMRDGKNFNLVRVRQMQTDINSPQMLYMNDFLLRAFPDSLKQGFAVKDALKLLRNWNGSMSAESPEAAIIAQWFQKMVELTFKDELGDTLFSQYVYMAQSPIKALREACLTNSIWFDNIHTTVKETRDDIIRKAFSQALDSLNRYYSNWQITTWKFGDFHTLIMRHTFHEQKALNGIVDIGPFNLGGCNTTLANAEWDFNNPFQVRVGATMRLVVDFSDSTTFIHNIVSTGSSGQPLSNFYKNQSVIWSAGGLLNLGSIPPSNDNIVSTIRLFPIK
ncbi:MAG: penicillin acylase family protein [Chlorobiota bacterium]|nr:MAG: penicillin acylase family protein [Chlorobiota bacterium]